jgi:hypothetical protein
MQPFDPASLANHQRIVTRESRIDGGGRVENALSLHQLRTLLLDAVSGAQDCGCRVWRSWNPQVGGVA